MPKLYSIRSEIEQTLCEYKVTSLALTRFQVGILSGLPGFALFDKLEGTYLIRMWAILEAAWVLFWKQRTNRPHAEQEDV